MLDFTSALYLGLRHAGARLRSWARLTTGVPAALETPPLSRAIASDLADLTGVERATLASSTLHAFWDLFVILSREDAVEICMDAGAYPIARWGVERAGARRVPVRTFAHHDAGGLHHVLLSRRRRTLRPIVVADGFCPGCGKPAPLGRYIDMARPYGGRLVIDDTQALGIFGAGVGRGGPYGSGGGGSLRRLGIGGPDVIVVSSLAKGFGVPMAMIGGGEDVVRRFEAESATRVHCSPPSFAELHAAQRALEINRTQGEGLRHRLGQLVFRFHDGARRLGVTTGSTLFPAQILEPEPDMPAVTLHRRLSRIGVRTVLSRPACRPSTAVGFIITARHSAAQIDSALSALGAALGLVAPPSSRFEVTTS